MVEEQTKWSPAWQILKNGIEVGCLSAGCQHSGHTTFEGGNLGGYCIVRRVLQAGIEIAAFLQIEQFSHLLARLILECRALIDREDTGFSFLGLPTGLYAQGFRFEFVIHIGCFFN